MVPLAEQHVRNVDSVPWVVANRGHGQTGKRDGGVDQEDLLYHTLTVQLTPTQPG